MWRLAGNQRRILYGSLRRGVEGKGHRKQERARGVERVHRYTRAKKAIHPISEVFFFTGIGTVNGRQLIIYYIRLMLLKDTVDVVVVAASSAPRQSGDGSRTSDAAFVTCVVG